MELIRKYKNYIYFLLFLATMYVVLFVNMRALTPGGYSDPFYISTEFEEKKDDSQPEAVDDGIKYINLVRRPVSPKFTIDNFETLVFEFDSELNDGDVKFFLEPYLSVYVNYYENYITITPSETGWEYDTVYTITFISDRLPSKRIEHKQLFSKYSIPDEAVPF